MGEYLKGLVASAVFVLTFALDWLNLLNTDWIPKLIAGISAVLVVLTPNLRNGRNVRKQ